jgi:hypothetical protein
MEMADLAQILEEELGEAVEVKNRKSLHRYITLLTDNLVKREDNKMEHSEFQQELIKIDGRFNQMITEVREGFKRMDQRFEAVEQRFEAVDKKFESVQQQMDRRFVSMERHFDKRFYMMFSFITIGFVVMATMMSVFQFLG